MNNREMKDLIKKSHKFANPFRVEDGSFRLKNIDPGDTLRLTSEDKPRAKEALAMGVSLLAELQDMLYAQDRWAVLFIFQAMDAAGKDSAAMFIAAWDIFSASRAARMQIDRTRLEVRDEVQPADRSKDHDAIVGQAS
jgi:polyphosphate kinase 2 (PPK2 family)